MLDENQILELQQHVVDVLKYVYDPEIPVNIYDLGLIYGIDITEAPAEEVTGDGFVHVHIRMTLTAPSCPESDFLMEDIRIKVEGLREGLRCRTRLRTRVEQGHDDRGGQTRARFPLT